MKSFLILFLFVVIPPLLAQTDCINIDCINIDGKWSGGEFLDTTSMNKAGYYRWCIEMCFDYLDTNNKIGTYFTILLARTLGGGLNSWEIEGVFEKYQNFVILYPINVRVGSVVLPKEQLDYYLIKIIFSSDTTAFIPSSIFGIINLKKQKK